MARLALVLEDRRDVLGERRRVAGACAAATPGSDEAARHERHHADDDLTATLSQMFAFIPVLTVSLTSP